VLGNGLRQSRSGVGDIPDPFSVRRCPAAQEAAAATWVSVRDAAVVLMRDLPHVGFAQAKVMVSRAATRGCVQSNGAAYQKRRLYPMSLAAWRLEMRDRDLDAEEREEAA